MYILSDYLSIQETKKLRVKSKGGTKINVVKFELTLRLF